MHPYLILFFLLLQVNVCFAQPVPVGHWREHQPYLQALAVTPAGGKLFCATPYNLFSVTPADHDITRYNKLNGLSDAGISATGAAANGQVLLIAYRNGNVDLLKQERIYNLPDIKRSNIQGDKTIHSIYAEGDRAWLCAGFGIVVVNTDKVEVADTYIIGAAGQPTAVYAVASDGNYYYAATAEGMKRAPARGSNLASYESWEPLMQGLAPGAVQQVIHFSGALLCRRQDTLFQWQQQWQPWYTDGWQLQHMAVHDNELLVCSRRPVSQVARILRLEGNGAMAGELLNPLIKAPVQAAGLEGAIWIADAQNGLIVYNNNGFTGLLPNAPAGIVAGRMLYANNTLWATAGAVTANWAPAGNRDGFYAFSQEQWRNFNYRSLPYLDSIKDLLPLAADAAGNLYLGSFGNGLLVLKPDETHQLIRQPELPTAIDDPRACRVSGLAVDAGGNLWLTAYGADRNVLVRKKDNSWLRFRIPYVHTYNAVSDILIDDLDQKWIISPRGNGLFVLNHGGSLDNAADDQWKLYRSGSAEGNLPSSNVRCLAKDKDGWIWIGTDKGVAVITCAGEVFGNGCPAYLPIVQQDNFAGYLFRDEQVNAIAVDGANRKWVGTGNGAWLIDPAGEKILAHFNAANSPLPDNAVNGIAIDPVSGEVFFATAQGLVSYRGTATEGKPNMQADSVLVFPNPVPPGYGGAIAIRGLVQNALVRITDTSGRLVYENRAQGGQAVWSGKDYTGRRPQSGVYLVFATDDTGKERLATKIVFIN